MKFERLAKWYTYAALFSFNAALFFLLIVFGYFVVTSVKDNLSDPVTKKYGKKSVAEVYPHLNEQEIRGLLTETWSRQYVYEPFTQFKERPFHGKFVNVDEHGFRLSKNQGPWPPDPTVFNVFVFGGSTTFGYGVEDDQTIASHLQEYLNNKLGFKINIYNFGRGHYYSTQERILFEQLIAAGFIPKMAIFMDGMNDFYYKDDKPKYTERLEGFIGGKGPSFISRIPFVKNFVETRDVLPKTLNRQIPNTGGNPYDDLVVIRRVIERYLTNKKMIEAVASSYDIKAIFVWQPAPTFRYDTNYHLFYRREMGKHEYSVYGYKKFEEMKEKSSLGSNFLWCADMQQDMKQPLYVDVAHYTATFSKQLAVFIGDQMIAQGFFPN